MRKAVKKVTLPLKTKKEKIIHLLETTSKTVDEIATKVGCSTTHVYVTRREYLEPRYARERAQAIKARVTSDEVRARRREYFRDRYHNDPSFKARVKAQHQAGYLRKREEEAKQEAKRAKRR